MGAPRVLGLAVLAVAIVIALGLLMQFGGASELQDEHHVSDASAHSGPHMEIGRFIGAFALLGSTSWVTSLDEAHDLKEEWDSLRERCKGSIFTSHQLDSIWYQSYQGAEPRILAIRDGGALVALLPLVSYSSRSGGVRSRTLGFAGGWGGRLNYNHVGALVEPGRLDLMDEAAREIKRAEWDRLQFRSLSPNDANRRLVSRVKAEFSGREKAPMPTVTCPIPMTGDVLSNFGKRTQSNIRYKIRRLEKESDVEFRSVASEGVDGSVDAHIEQHIKRWRGKGGSLFSDPSNAAFLRNLVTAATSEGFGRMNELLIDGEVAAQDFVLLDGDVARMFRGGMNDDLAAHSPGMLLFPYEMEWLRGRGMRFINLGRGDDEYKMHMGGRVDHLIGVEAGRGLFAFRERMSRYNLGRMRGLARKRLAHLW